MSNTTTELIAWLKTNPGLGASEASYFRGQISETEANAAQTLVSVLAEGGGATGVLLDTVGYTVTVFGPKDNPAGTWQAIEDTLNAVRLRLKDDYKACGIAQIAVIGGIIGPGRTTDDRPWYDLNLQLTI